MQNLKLLLLTLGITMVLVAGGVWWLMRNGAGQTSIPQPTEQQMAVVTTGDGWEKGASASAQPQFTIVEFSDFQCPGCAAAAPQLNALVDKYPQDIRLIYHYFPLQMIHQHSAAAAQWAEAAGRLGKFWAMHDALFAAQNQWAAAANPQEIWQQLAQEAGLDVLAVQNLATSAAVIEHVAADTRLAEQMRLPGTPSLLVNGTPMSLTEVLATIENALGKASNR